MTAQERLLLRTKSIETADRIAHRTLVHQRPDGGLEFRWLESAPWFRLWRHLLYRFDGTTYLRRTA